MDAAFEEALSAVGPELVVYWGLAVTFVVLVVLGSVAWALNRFLG